MQILKQLHRKFIHLIEYSTVYFIGIIIIVGIFSFIYYKLGVTSPVSSSVNVFFGIGNITTLPRYAHLLQIVIQNIFFFSWVGTLLSTLLRPLNPFFFSKYLVCCNHHLILRYWIMFPAHQFLYDIHIRIILSAGRLYNGGVNKLSGEWQFAQDINLARGVHFVALSKKDTQTLLKKINQLKSEDKLPVLAIMIQGSNENGLTFFGRKSYILSSCLKKDYNFVPIRQPECVRIAQELGYKKEIPERPALIRYQHFDKLYHISGKSDPDNKDVLTCKQLAEGEYGPGIHQSISDFINLIVSHFLDKNGYRDFIQPSDHEK